MIDGSILKREKPLNGFFQIARLYRANKTLTSDKMPKRDRSHPFSILFYDYHPVNGSFMASSYDIYGTASLVGVIDGVKITFDKKYKNPASNMPPELEELHFRGGIIAYEDRIIMGGDYWSEATSPFKGGYWRVDNFTFPSMFPVKDYTPLVLPLIDLFEHPERATQTEF
mgnify:CR=1 FL=1